MIEEDRRMRRNIGSGARMRRGTKARKHQVELRRAEGSSERRMADRNEDFNWYLGLELFLSGQAARSFCYCFFLPAFSLSFAPRHLFPSFLSPRKRFTEAIPGEATIVGVICIPAKRSRKLRQGVRVRARDRTQRARHEGEKASADRRAVNGYVIAITAARNRKQRAGGRIVSILEQLIVGNYDKFTASLRQPSRGIIPHIRGMI